MLKKTAIFISAALGITAMTNCKTNDTAGAKGIDIANLDTTVSARENFYDYACGGWMKSHPITGEYSRYGTFEQLDELSRQQILDLVTSIDRASAEPGSNAQKIADLYAMGMDSVTLNSQGAQALAADIARINATTPDSVMDVLATLPGNQAFFDADVDADMKNASMNVMYIGQDGLGMSDRDYYLSDDENEVKVREAYKVYLNTLAHLVGYDDEQAQRLVDNTMAIETALAKASTPRAEMRDPAKMYNPMKIADFVKKNPKVDLNRYFSDLGINDIDSVIVCQPAFFNAVNKILADTPQEAINDYITAGYLRSAASFLSDDFLQAQFEYNKVASGIKEMRPRWKRALGVPNGMLSEALGQLYVEKYFPASSKEKMLSLVKNLQKALGEHIDSLTWMSDTTKVRAHEKLDNFIIKIGYPDKWRDYSALTIDPSKSYWENIQNAMVFNRDFALADFGKPVDNTRWYMSPQTVNAYYNPTTNEICFPAAILQPPFFDPEADDAINYGAIGVVIGHEMTHGFDDQGRQYDKDGNLSNWWTDADAAAFTALADKLVEQFDQVIVIDSIHANGKLTLGENIADQGGLRVARTAYHNSLNGAAGEDIDGLSPDQRFYLAYANVWAANIRDEEIKNRTKTDPHSLGRWRVNATLRNIEPFFEAFGIVEGDPMFRPEAERVIIW